MKNCILSFLALTLMVSSTALAHDIHRQASDHYHPAPVYTHSVSSAYDHGLSPIYYGHNDDPYHTLLPVAQNYTTNTATYYTRYFPFTNTYPYLTTPNTTIHQPPFAYSTCASNCTQTQKRIMVSRNISPNAKTYRAPSEYSAQQNIIITPQNRAFSFQNTRFHNTTYISPNQNYHLNTSTCYRCTY